MEREVLGTAALESLPSHLFFLSPLTRMPRVQQTQLSSDEWKQSESDALAVPTRPKTRDSDVVRAPDCFHNRTARRSTCAAGASLQWG